MDLSNYKHYITVKDHTVSGEYFDLYLDDESDMLITTPVPEESQLGKYYESEDYISHTDGKRSLFEKLYHFIKSIALKNKLALINRFSDKGCLLDIGAGTGDFLLTAQTAGWDALGIEPNPKAKTIAAQKGIRFAENTQQLDDHTFDVITMWHVLEHVPDIMAQVKEIKRLLKQEGTVIIAVPNFRSFDAQYYGQFWAAYDVPRHLSHFSKTAIRHLFGKQDMQVETIYPMKFDAFYVSLLSEKYKTGKMNFIRAFIAGLRSNFKARHNFEYSSHIYVLKNKKSQI